MQIEGDSRAKRQGEADVEDVLTNASCKKITYDHQEVEGSVRYCQASVPLCSGSSSSCAALGEDLAIEQSSELSISHQGASKVLDELEDDLGLMDQVHHVGSATEGIPVQSAAKHEIATATEASKAATATATAEIGATSYKLHQSGVLEELEPVELTASVSNVESLTVFVPPRKPLIRLNFTTSAKTTGKGA